MRHVSHGLAMEPQHKVTTITLNFASTFKPPVILNVVNNQWAISTHQNLATGGRTFAERGLAYDIPSIRVDGNDFLALYSVTKWARERASAGLDLPTSKFTPIEHGAHSSSDDPSAYRPDDEFLAGLVETL